ncbi:MAG: hypothetical protein OXH37_11475, partial [Gammaproteobacteria bacterium]|nr:hypothetical protein [Gammaproteobacteria bacterium]
MTALDFPGWVGWACPGTGTRLPRKSAISHNRPGQSQQRRHLAGLDFLGGAMARRMGRNGKRFGGGVLAVDRRAGWWHGSVHERLVGWVGLARPSPRNGGLVVPSALSTLNVRVSALTSAQMRGGGPQSYPAIR